MAGTLSQLMEYVGEAREKGLLYIQIAKELGYTPGHITHLLTGRSQMSIEQLERICNVIGVRVILVRAEDEEVHQKIQDSINRKASPKKEQPKSSRSARG